MASEQGMAFKQSGSFFYVFYENDRTRKYWILTNMCDIRTVTEDKRDTQGFEDAHYEKINQSEFFDKFMSVMNELRRFSNV